MKCPRCEHQDREGAEFCAPSAELLVEALHAGTGFSEQRTQPLLEGVCTAPTRTEPAFATPALWAKRSGWVLVCLAVSSLLLASCGGSQPTTTTTNSTTATTTTVTAPPVEKPQYGGQIVVTTAYNWQDFDEVVGSQATFNHTMRFTNQELWIGDWSRGPAGTNETQFTTDRAMMYKTGDLAESWDFSGWDEGKLTFKIRKGVHWALNPNSEASRLVNGREVTADDVVYSFKQVCTNPAAYLYKACPVLRTARIYAPDKYTFVVEAAPPTATWFLRVTDLFRIVPHEVVEKYGSMKDWRNSVGSGPFILKDVVDNSSVTFVRNPNYWAKNPCGPGKGDQLPYVDSVKFLVIADTSTQQSAFRTGRIDTLGADYKDGHSFIKALPDAKFVQFPAFGGVTNTAMRTDKAPFNDIRVRRALFMALDFRAIAEALYGPGFRFLSWPIGYSPEYKAAYLDVTDPDCPQSVKDLYTYSPDKAIQLLKDAGQYPLKGNIIVWNDASIMDYYQTIQAYWAKVGVDVTLDPREAGAFTAALASRSYDFMMCGTASPIMNLHSGASMSGNTATNPSYINDPVVNAAIPQMMALSIKDDPAADKIHRELMKYVLDRAWCIPSPGGVSYALWWPWLKNYYGAMSLGYMNYGNWVTWAWVDQTLKHSMGH